ncbi:MAG: autotransporter-associated beta strand repeat-containing protein [Verrucomicrobiota bacterium]
MNLPTRSLWGAIAAFSLVLVSITPVCRAAEIDVALSYSPDAATRHGGEDNIQVNLANALAGTNATHDRSGTSARFRIAGYYQSIANPIDQDNTAVVIALSNDAAYQDVRNHADSVGADFISYYAHTTGAAGNAGQPGRYSTMGEQWIYYAVVAHELGHNQGCDHRDGNVNPKTIMMHNYCGGGAQGFFSNPNIWLNGTRLQGSTSCIGDAVANGDNAYVISSTSQGNADIANRPGNGPKLTNVTRRWRFDAPAGSAPNGTTVNDSVSGANPATVLGTGATYTGKALRLPGGTGASGAAYLELPSGLVSPYTDVTVEVWATPLSARNWARILEFNDNSANNYVMLTSSIGNDLNAQRFESKVGGATVTLGSGIPTVAGVPHLYTISFKNNGAGGGRWQWYRDGDAIAFLDVAYTLATAPNLKSWLGRSIFGGDDLAHCDYAEVRVSNVAMNQHEILANYKLGPNWTSSNVPLTADDALGQSSFATAGGWSDALAPSAGKSYETFNYRLRTPADGVSRTFGGNSLKLSGGSLTYKGTASSTTTINNLTTTGGCELVQAGSGTWTLAGSLAPASDLTAVRAANGPINLTANLSGSGPLLYLNNTVTLGGTNTSFTGRTLVGDGRLSSVFIDSEARLGANPATFTADQFTFNRGVLYTTSNQTIDDSNRGIRINESAGIFNVAGGTTLTIAVPLSSPSSGANLQTAPLFPNPAVGMLIKENTGTLNISHPNNSHSGEIVVNGGTLALTGAGRINNGDTAMSMVINATLLMDTTANQNFSGAFSGGGSFIKNNSGTTTLVGANNLFTGAVTINGGTLYANAANAANNRALSGTSGVIVNSGATLRTSANALFGWDGTQDRPITVNAGGTLVANGGGTGDVGVGTVTLAGGTLTSFAASTAYGTFRFDNATDRLLVTQDSTASATNVKFGNAAASIDVASGKTLNFTGTITNATSGGTSYLTKAGAGTLILAGTNTYTGATALNAGTTVVNGSLAAGSAVTVANGAAISGMGTVNGALGFTNGSRLLWTLPANSEAVGVGSKLNTGTVTVANGALVDFTFNGPGSTTDFSQPFWSQPHSWTVLTSSGMAGTFALGAISVDPGGRPLGNYGKFTIQQGAGGVTLLYSPLGAELPPIPTGFAASASPGKVVLTWSTASGAATYNVKRATSPGGPYVTIATGVTSTSFIDNSMVNGTVYYYVVSSVNPNGESSASSESVATPHLPSIFNKADNTIALNLSGSWTGGIIPNALDTARWTGLSGANSVSLGTDMSVTGIIIASTGGAVSIGAGNTLTLGTGGLDLSAATENLTISSSLILGAGNQPWNVASGRTLTLDTGTFTRSTGATVTRPNTGTVTTNMVGIVNDSTGILGGWATIPGVGTGDWVTLTGGNMTTYAGYTPIAAATAADANQNWLSTVNAAGITASGTLNSLKMTADFNIPNGATLTLASGGLLMSGPQKWLLNNGVGTTAGTGMLTSGLTTGELFVHVAKSDATNWSIWSTIVNNGATAVTLVKNGPGLVYVRNANTFTGGTHLNGGTILAANATALGTGTLNMNGGNFGTTAALTIANAITVAGTNTIGHAAQAANSITLSGALTGNGTLKNFVGAGGGSSSVFFTGSLSGFTGTIDYTDDGGANAQWWRAGANGSTVDLSNASVILRVGNVSNTVASKNFGFADNISGATLKIGALSGDGVLQSSFNNAGPNTLEVGALDTSTTFSGVLSGAAAGTNMAFTKVGAGTLTLSGTNTYSGATAVNAGTLVVIGNHAGATGALTVAANATLGGNGNLGGNVTINASGIHSLAVAATPGAQVTRAITGTLTNISGNILNLAASSAPAVGVYTLVTATGGISALPTTITGFTGGVVSISGNSLILTVSDSAYNSWASSKGLTGANNGIILDPDFDNVSNVLEFVLSGNPLASDPLILPDPAVTATDFTFTFSRADQSKTEVGLTFQYGSDLTGWTNVAIGTESAGAVSITPNGTAPDTVVVTIPKNSVPGGKLFGRLRAVK